MIGKEGKPRPVGLKGARGELRSGAWQEFPRRIRVFDGLAGTAHAEARRKTSPGPHRTALSETFAATGQAGYLVNRVH